MSRHSYILTLFVSIVAVAWVTVAAQAANVTATKAKNYGRFVFTFNEAATLKTESNGDTATLTFNRPIADSAQSIQAAMPDYVRRAVISQDKKRVTLTLYQPYRVRQFVSGSGVGIDLVGQPSTTAEKPKPEPKPKPETKPKPSAKAVAEAKAMAAKSPAAKPKEDPMLSTKKTSTEAASTPEKAKAEAKEKPQDILTTKKEAATSEPKKEEAPAAVKKAEAPKPEAEKPSDASMLSTKEPEPAPAAPTRDTPIEPPPVGTASEPAKPAAPEAKPTAPDTSPLGVTVATAHGETTLTFPWKERVGAGVVQRARDIWVIFSKTQPIDIAAIRAGLPQNVIKVTPYEQEGNLILRLTTDGTLNASAEQTKGSYSWRITLGPNAGKPKLGVSLNSDALEGDTRLIINVYDIAKPLRFYDPSAGDLLILIPSFEDGRGLTPARNFPEFSLLQTPQGLGIVSKRDDLKITPTRSGLVISAPGGLAISEILPTSDGSKPLPGVSANTGVMMPYEQWHVPHDQFLPTLSERLHAVAHARPAERPERLFDVAKLYVAEGMMAEASGILDLIRAESPDYYFSNRLALIHGAAYVMMGRFPDAHKALAAPELAMIEEAILWKQVVAINLPEASTAEKIVDPKPAVAQAPDAADTPEAAAAADAASLKPEAGGAQAQDAIATTGPTFQLLKYNKSFIRYYPPRIRQRLTVMAADSYIREGQEDKALAAFDILVRDGIIDPVAADSKYALGAMAIKKGAIDSALDIFDGMAKNKINPRAAALGRYHAAKLRYKTGKMTPEEAADALESIRISWRGDRIEYDVLNDLVMLYIELKQYDNILRTYKATLDAFPDDPRTLAISADMSQLFTRLFLDGQADEMEPLKALSLFYEFRDLTPLGDNGDLMIQRLADRLAGVDLLARATQLLEHQIKFRLKGEARSRVGARLALLYLLDKQPKEALNVLETTNFGNNAPELQLQRQQLLAQALSELGKNEEALNALYNDRTETGARLRLEILWNMQDWPNVANRAEDILSARPNLTDPLSPKETETLLKLAIAYTFEGDYEQLRYLRDYYQGLIPDSGYKQIFDFITNDTTPLDADDFNLVAQQISRTESFLDTFKKQIADGKLSEAVK